MGKNKKSIRMLISESQLKKLLSKIKPIKKNQ